MLDLVLLVSGAAVGIWVFRAFDRAVVSFIGTMSSIFGGWHPDPWPHGIQEEDRDRRWGRPAADAPDGSTTPPPRVPMTKVRGFVSAR